MNTEAFQHNDSELDKYMCGFWRDAAYIIELHRFQDITTWSLQLNKYHPQFSVNQYEYSTTNTGEHPVRSLYKTSHQQLIPNKPQHPLKTETHACTLIDLTYTYIVLEDLIKHDATAQPVISQYTVMPCVNIFITWNDFDTDVEDKYQNGLIVNHAT